MAKLFEFSRDSAQNRRYIVELLIAYTFAVLASYVLLTIISPALITSENSVLRGVAATTYLVDVYMCHEMPERSLDVGGQHMPLCERCFAIMVGALLAYPFALGRKSLPRIITDRRVVIASIVLSMGLLGLDGGAQLLGWWESNTLVRVFTGFLSAFTVMFYLLLEVQEKFQPHGSILRQGVVLPAAIPFAFLLLVFLAAAAAIGPQYRSAGYALGEAEGLSPGAQYYYAYYIAPKAFSGTISMDPFLPTYDDPILQDVGGLRARRHEMGAWAAAALDEPANYEGKYAFLSSTPGAYYYFDAWTGELVAARRHN